MHVILMLSIILFVPKVKFDKSAHCMKILNFILQEDLLARKRQLATMDLFLESARQQLKLLISDTETKDGS